MSGEIPVVIESCSGTPIWYKFPIHDHCVLELIRVMILECGKLQHFAIHTTVLTLTCTETPLDDIIDTTYTDTIVVKQTVSQENELWAMS